MGKLILASNLPRAEKPMQVVGAHMQNFCNCNPRVDEKAGTNKAA